MSPAPLTPLAESLPSTVPFVGPETQERRMGRAFRARLGANESLFGPSPQVVAALRAAAPEVWKYGDPDLFDLKTALAAHHGCHSTNIVVGEGIDGLLGTLVRLLVAPGDVVVTSDGAYPTFNFHVLGFGGTLHKVPYRADQEDPEALLAAAQRLGAKMIYLANPDNPMGSHLPAQGILALIRDLPETCLLVLDEAYADLAPAAAIPEIAADDARVIRLRTFSKGYGLAGLRVGYAIAAPALALAFDKLRNHFGVGRLAQAGALAALADQAWLEQVRIRVAVGRTEIGRIARANGLVPLASATNFVTVDCGRDGAFARALLAELLARGVFVRMPGVAPLDRCIRISVGDAAALAVLDEVLPAALAALR